MVTKSIVSLFFRIISLNKQLLAIILALFMLLGATINVKLNGQIEDTQDTYMAQIASMSFYENDLDTAVPQTSVYKILYDHFNSPLPEGKTEKKAVVVGYDGCRADADSLGRRGGAVRQLLDDGGHAYISYCGGANYSSAQTQDTSTAPGWCSMLTGEWGKVTGITSNGIVKSNDYLSLLTTLVEGKVIDDSAFIVSWGGHFTGDKSTYKLEAEYCKENNLDVSFVKKEDDIGVAACLFGDIIKPECSDFLFGILEAPDSNGHGTGFSPYNPMYDFGVKNAEIQGGLLVNAVTSRATYDTEDWLILITSDHGGYETKHGGPTIQERMTFIVSNKDLSEYVPKAVA